MVLTLLLTGPPYAQACPPKLSQLAFTSKLHLGRAIGRVRFFNFTSTADLDTP
jgi:hypothetical protein